MAIELGGNISLTGFAERDVTEMIVVKKIVGQYARKISDHTQSLQELKLTLKQVHGSKVELHTLASIHGKEYASQSVSTNLYIALDTSLKHVWQQVQKS